MALRKVLLNLRCLLQSCTRQRLIDGATGLATAQSHTSAAPLVSLTTLRCLDASPSCTLLVSPACFRHLSTAGPPAEAQAFAPAEESLEQIRARIFGMHIGNGQRSGRKVLRRGLIGDKLVAWYPVDLAKHDPLMPDLKADAAKLKLDRLRRRGKAPPKKGAGKRSKKK